ncbi:MAG: hypothetical protein M3Q19_02160 [Pseudomonadota bacterium]|nr:hypothetical protein [Pseudomonadota bacterium]
MDLPYFTQRHQTSLAMSREAACAGSRIAHRKMAEAYAALISAARRSSSSSTPVCECCS